MRDEEGRTSFKEESYAKTYMNLGIVLLLLCLVGAGNVLNYQVLKNVVSVNKGSFGPADFKSLFYKK